MILGLITYYGKWTYLYKEWLTSLDHKKIGIMYIILALVMLLRGFSDAILMRSQQAVAAGGSLGFLPPEHFNQIFSAHGSIMIIFMAMPFLVGLMNIVVPQQIGARDVAFPFMNSLSLWLTTAGALLVMVSLGVGEFSQAGWSGYTPLTELAVQPRHRGGLLDMVLPDRRYRLDPDRYQFSRHHPENARSRHEAHADAVVCLDYFLHHGARGLGLSGSDGRSRHDNPRSLPGYAFFHQRRSAAT